VGEVSFMSFIHWGGTSPTNPNSSLSTAHLILAHPTVSDYLVLAEFLSGDPYQQGLEGMPQSDGRSLTGVLRVVGGNHSPKRRWDCTFAVKLPQLDLFNQLIAAQSSSTVPIVLQDNFVAPAQYSVWLDVGPQYATTSQSLSWWLLQFTALQDS
jgi:hypothetical protein